MLRRYLMGSVCKNYFHKTVKNALKGEMQHRLLHSLLEAQSYLFQSHFSTCPTRVDLYVPHSTYVQILFPNRFKAIQSDQIFPCQVADNTPLFD